MKTKGAVSDRELGDVWSYLKQFHEEFGFEPDDPGHDDCADLELFVQYVTAERMKKLINIFLDLEVVLINAEIKNTLILQEIKEIKLKLDGRKPPKVPISGDSTVSKKVRSFVKTHILRPKFQERAGKWHF